MLNGPHESRERPLDRSNVRFIRQRGVDVAAEIGRHLRTGLPNDQDIPLSFQADEVARLKDDIVPGDGCLTLAMVDYVVVLGEKENAADGPGRGLFDLIEDRPARNKIRLPVQNSRAQAEQKPLDGCRGCFGKAGVPEEDVTPLREQVLPVMEGNPELVAVQPAQIGRCIELADVPSKALVEHHAAANISLHQYQGGQTQCVSKRPLIVIEFCWQQGGLPLNVSEVPARHPEHRRSHAAPGNFVSVARVPGLRRREAGSTFGVRENFRRVTELLDLLHNAPLQFVEIWRKPWVGRQANVNAAGYRHLKVILY